MRKSTFWHVRPMNTQISLCIRAVWSVSFVHIKTLHPLLFSEVSDCTAQMRKLIWIFVCPKICFLVLRINLLITTIRLFKYIENFISKNWNFSVKNSDIFHMSAQNIYCGYSLEPPRRGGSNEYPQFVFLSRNKKHNEYPCKPQFYYIKVGFKGVKII